MGGPSHRQNVHSGMERGRLDGQAVPPGQDFDAELYALYQASKILDGRSEQGQDYTILSERRSRVRGLTELALDSNSRFPSQRCVAA